jgi:hypothetical protein
MPAKTKKGLAWYMFLFFVNKSLQPEKVQSLSSSCVGANLLLHQHDVVGNPVLQVLHPCLLLPPGVPTPSLPFLLCKIEQPTLTDEAIGKIKIQLQQNNTTKKS